MARTPINRDPYCDVQLSNVEHRGVKTDKWVVEIVNEEGDLVTLPGVSGVHGEDYALVPNRQIFDLVGDVLTRTGQTFKPVPTFGDGHSKPIAWDGSRRYSAKWYCEDIVEDLPGDHSMALGVEAVNSYDGSHPVGIRFFAMNCLCSNQFYISNLLGNFVFKHVSREAGVSIGDNVDDTLKILHEQAIRFMQVVSVFGTLQQWKLDGMGEFLKFRSAINKECWKRTRDPEILDELNHCGVTKDLGIPQAASVDNYLGLLNAYTAVCTHKVGGFLGASASDQVTQFTIARAQARELAAA